MSRHDVFFCRPVPVVTVLRLLWASWLLGMPALSSAAPPQSGIVPRWIIAEGRGDAIVLAWMRDERFSSVRIYRIVPGVTEEFKPVAQTGDSTYSDTDVVPGRVYRYRLAALDAGGEEGPPSAEQSVRLAARGKERPTPPVWLGHLPDSEGVKLKWGAQEGADVIVYNVYRKTPPDSVFQLRNSLRGTSFTDTTIEPGRPTFYALTALDSTFLETGYSAELQVLYARLPPPKAGAAAPKLNPRRTRLVAMVGGGDQPFLRPADVAVGPVSGNVYVTDSGRNRVFVFDGKGAFLRSIGAPAGSQTAFKRLIGLGVDREERLCVADAGQVAVLVINPNGGTARRVPLATQGKRASGFADCAAGPDGSLFIIDNSNDSILLSRRSGTTSVFGAAGSGPGELAAPTFCTTDAEGQFYVADTLNGRIQVFSAAGQFVRALGVAGRGPGRMLRPKGVAVAANGEVYVADSWQNSVQVYTASGQPVAVLADESGEPLDLGSPNGVALGPGNTIYVAERLSARLQIRVIVDESR